MLSNYEDILSRIAEPPRWFDEQGVPRYCDFAPHHIANIYADECALLAIACQSCGRPFIVAHTQNSNPRRVLEYWERIQETYTDPASGLRAIRGWRHWTRDHNLEIEIPDRE
jgi:DNA-directed RNA polymerase subunit N (RpoN/RPB10)